MKKLLAIAAFATSLFAGDSLYLAIKANTTAMNYTETRNGSTLDTEKSNLFGKIGGFNIDGSAKIANNFLYADTTKIILNYEYVSGDSNYVGSLLGSNAGYGSYTSTTSNTIQRGQILLSQINNTSYGNAMLNFGAGKRVWNRNLSSIQKEEYNWNYLIAGLGFDFNFGSNFTLGAAGYYQQAITPKMNYNSNSFNTNFNLGNTYGYRIEVPASYKITQYLSLVGSWTLDNWTINQSNSVTYNGASYVEPKSVTNNQSLSLGLALNF